MFSRAKSYLDSDVENVTGTSSIPSPLIRGRLRTESVPEGPELAPNSSQDFADGLREATGQGIEDGESQPVNGGGITSTQKITTESPIFSKTG